MRLLAISDLHLTNLENMLALKELPPQQEEWLILAGDLCESRYLCKPLPIESDGL